MNAAAPIHPGAPCRLSFLSELAADTGQMQAV